MTKIRTWRCFLACALLIAGLFVAPAAAQQSTPGYTAGTVLGRAGCYEITPIGTLVLYLKPDGSSFDRASCVQSWSGGPERPGQQSVLRRWGYFEVTPTGELVFYPHAQQ